MSAPLSPVTAGDVARDLFQRLQNGPLYPGEVAYEVAETYGPQFAKQTAHGHLTIDDAVMRELNKLAKAAGQTLKLHGRAHTRFYKLI